MSCKPNRWPQQHKTRTASMQQGTTQAQARMHHHQGASSRGVRVDTLTLLSHCNLIMSHNAMTLRESDGCDTTDHLRSIVQTTYPPHHPSFRPVTQGNCAPQEPNCTHLLRSESLHSYTAPSAPLDSRRVSSGLQHRLRTWGVSGQMPVDRGLGLVRENRVLKP